VGFEVPISVDAKSSTFRDITPRGQLEMNCHFGSSPCCVPHDDFLLGLLFGLEDGGEMFLRNFRSFSMG
jgi:hypothetical protein